jgi:hypothetical protein
MTSAGKQTGGVPVRVLSSEQTATTAEAPRRLNAASVLAMQHEERMASLNRPGREDRPRFALKRSTASGSLGVVAIDVEVPVCEEYPTSELAFEATLAFMDRAAEHYPTTNGKPA